MLVKSVLTALVTATAVLSEGFNVVIKHVQPIDGTCTCPHGDNVFPTLSLTGSSESSPSHEAVSTPVATVSESTSTDNNDGPISTITPAVHWSYDTTKIENIVPKDPSTGSPLYYGSSDPTEEGYYGWLTYHFSTCAVNLDESMYISSEYDSDSGLRVTFSHQIAFDKAKSTWSVDDGLVLIAFVDGCGEDHDRCYFKVTTLDFDSDKLCITATGSSEDPNDLIDLASTEWGWYVPGRSAGTGSSPSTQTISATVSAASTYATAASNSSSTYANSTTSSDNSTTSTQWADNSTSCTPPVDSVYGLPTACLGDYFDEDLSDEMGYITLANNTEFEEFMDSLAPEDSDSTSTLRRRASILDKVKAGAKSIGKKLASVPAAVKKAAASVLSFSGSINKSLSFQLPNPSSSDSSAKKLKDTSLKQVESPWGEAILLKSFGDSSKYEDAKGKAGYLNIYCVDCGAKGSVKVVGRATWTPVGMTFTQGQLEMTADIKIGLKLGVDAKIKASKTFSNDILDFGLPGLAYGAVTIGPRISVGSSVTLAAAAEGKLLAGAEMGITDSLVLIDWVNNANSKTTGWQPYFQPVFQADGELMVSAELGLPVGLKCGVKIATWDKSVGITDTPSIKAVAQIAASIGLSDSGFSGGLNSSDGCQGISTSISWRNKIDVDIFGLWDKTLFDTNDKTLKQQCIKLGSSTTSTTSAATAAATTKASRMRIRDDSNSTTTSNSTIVDYTDRISGNDTLSYNVTDVQNSAYNQTDGYEYSLLVDEDVETMVVACSNGNTYLAGINSTGLEYCTELFASYSELLVEDGAGRYLHYYNNTMSKLGVSRLRVADEDDLPAEGVVVVMMPYSVSGDEESDAATAAVKKRDGEEADPDTTDYDDYSYYAVDPEYNFFYPAVCTYTDGSLPRMFLVNDTEAGVAKLKESALIYTVTGGTVDECYTLSLVEAKYKSDDDYASTDETEETYLDYEE
ncbi:hypothetical protein G7054_g1538 [Neopestalotiopsis clavispora]|nr:hypothetical protein G7054_g1538 [Neopestalotiopsis clavispora]